VEVRRRSAAANREARKTRWRSAQATMKARTAERRSGFPVAAAEECAAAEAASVVLCCRFGDAAAAWSFVAAEERRCEEALRWGQAAARTGPLPRPSRQRPPPLPLQHRRFDHRLSLSSFCWCGADSTHENGGWWRLNQPFVAKPAQDGRVKRWVEQLIAHGDEEATLPDLVDADEAAALDVKVLSQLRLFFLMRARWCL
jgi:hypothetical protein